MAVVRLIAAAAVLLAGASIVVHGHSVFAWVGVGLGMVALIASSGVRR